MRAGITRFTFIIGLTCLLLGCESKSLSNLNGTLLNPSLEIDDFSLLSAGETLKISDFEGKFVVLAFGYTYCPDACPTTMARLASTMRLLGEQADQVQVVLVSVDEQRDSPDKLAAYTEAFNDTFKGVWVSKPDSSAFFSTLGIYHERAVPTEVVSTEAAAENTEEYLIDHTTSTIVLDREGNWRLVWNFELSAEEMAFDLSRLIKHY